MGREANEIRDVREVGNFGDVIRAQRELAQVSLRQLAQLAGVSNPYLSQIERGLRRPSAQVMGQIAKALRNSADAFGPPAELLLHREPGLGEPRANGGASRERGAGTGGVRAAVLADRSLTARQKEALLQVYEAFAQPEGRSPQPLQGD